jgi:hypothetical protein
MRTQPVFRTSQPRREICRRCGGVKTPASRPTTTEMTPRTAAPEPVRKTAAEWGEYLAGLLGRPVNGNGGAPPPPDLNAAIRAARGLTPVESINDVERRERTLQTASAQRGDTAPPPIDLNARIRAMRATGGGR